MYIYPWCGNSCKTSESAVLLMECTPRPWKEELVSWVLKMIQKIREPCWPCFTLLGFLKVTFKVEILILSYQ